ncbi:hypothetical protein BWQ96_02922 [Gracilariopsis chorda]|uniref:Uncharacterized protein n=1 Tax=Gracilariopsis chorda TaxID=448386 RepID=A0A2V3IYY4_9FLOR|nr:hypothetical protein BWQ96_02922 [Gracilariopsis chorda]|eukprot:PXF47309.1 hypothetical protein BWQ96_02922 [Gracilariopsis chorda]
MPPARPALYKSHICPTHPSPTSPPPPSAPDLAFESNLSFGRDYLLQMASPSSSSALLLVAFTLALLLCSTAAAPLVSHANYMESSRKPFSETAIERIVRSSELPYLSHPLDTEPSSNTHRRQHASPWAVHRQRYTKSTPGLKLTSAFLAAA